MMVMVRGRNDLDHEVNGQYGDGNQGRAQEKLHFHQQPSDKNRYYQIIRSLSRRMATVKRLVKKICRGRTEHAEDEGPIPAQHRQDKQRQGPAA